MKGLRATAIGLMALSTSACTVVKDSVYDLLGMERPLAGDTDAFDTDWDEQLETSVDLPPINPPDVGSAVAEPTAVLPLLRSEKLLPLPGHGATNMGFRVDQLAEVYALAGAIEEPAWSAPSEGTPRSLRDDDLDTSWTCIPNADERCAIGMHFPSVAKAHSLRLFVAAPEFDAFPRVKRVRVHTEQGFTDALLLDTNAPQFVEFAEPVTTRNIVVEVLEIFPGRSKEPKIHIADLEVFGVEGVAREPLKLDPASTVTIPTGSVWRKSGRASFDRQETFLHWIDDAGNLHRFMEGSALRGRAGDRLLLVERISGQGECDSPRGTFFMLDTKTRVTAPLGGLDGVGGDAFRSADGNGIVVGFKGKLDTKLNGIFSDDGKYRRRQTPLRADLRAGENYFEQWNLEPDIVRREPPALNEAIEGCSVGTEATLAELTAAKEAMPKPKKKKRRRRRGRGEDDTPRPAAWQVCALADGARAFITDHGPCGARWEMTVLGADGSVVATEGDTAERSFLRVVRRSDAQLLVQVGNGTDNTAIWTVQASGLENIAPFGTFAVQPPAVCRENCLEPFPNPGAPVWQ